MRKERVGFAVCGSFCTHQQVLKALEALVEEYETVIPIVSENAAFTDTRFGTSDALMERLEASETDAEDLSALGPQIQGVDCAITLRELRPDVWKMSLRTGSRVNATAAAALLGGGGHAAAAGCTVEAPLEEAKRRILEAVAQVAPDFSAT